MVFKAPTVFIWMTNRNAHKRGGGSVSPLGPHNDAGAMIFLQFFFRCCKNCGKCTFDTKVFSSLAYLTTCTKCLPFIPVSKTLCSEYMRGHTSAKTICSFLIYLVKNSKNTQFSTYCLLHLVRSLQTLSRKRSPFAGTFWGRMFPSGLGGQFWKGCWMGDEPWWGPSCFLKKKSDGFDTKDWHLTRIQLYQRLGSPCTSHTHMQNESFFLWSIPSS